VHTEGHQAPTRWDSLKYYLAIAVIVTYVPAGYMAITYLDMGGISAVFLMYFVAMLSIRCASCSYAVFQRNELWVAWPWRSCPKCHRPLVRSPNSTGSHMHEAKRPPNKSLGRTRDG
jgi:hypothetical protein